MFQVLLKENDELIAQVKSYKAMALDARNQKSNIKQTEANENKFEEDSNFVTDLLSYEK